MISNLLLVPLALLAAVTTAVPSCDCHKTNQCIVTSVDAVKGLVNVVDDNLFRFPQCDFDVEVLGTEKYVVYSLIEIVTGISGTEMPDIPKEPPVTPVCNGIKAVKTSAEKYLSIAKTCAHKAKIRDCAKPRFEEDLMGILLRKLKKFEALSNNGKAEEDSDH